VRRARDRGVGLIGHVHRSIAQVPRDPGFDRGKLEFSSGSSRMFDEPLDFGARLVGRESKTLALEDKAVDHCTQVLPAERGSDGFSRRGSKTTVVAR